ncbi:hypothetical protein FRB90_003112 [Tulasnella sp. 427]|nr:hypothetical protein FRB90_003112 [Tulasnella sp. 427]
MAPYPVSPALIFITRDVLPGLAGLVIVSGALYKVILKLGLRQDVPIARDSTLVVALFAGSVVGQAVVKGAWNAFKAWSDKRRLGAIDVPMVRRGFLPGNISFLMELTRNFPREYPGEPLMPLKKEYGPIFNMQFLWEDLIWSDHPAFAKEILATGFDSYVKGPWPSTHLPNLLADARKQGERFQVALCSMLGTGIFNSDGDTWKFHRAMTRPFFTRDRITDFDIFDRHCEITLEKIKERCSTGQPIDFQDIVSRFTMDSAAEFLFGLDVHSLSSPLPQPGASPETTNEFNRFTAAFVNTLDAISGRIRFSGFGWQLKELLKDQTTDDMKVLYDYIEPILNGALKEKAAKKDGDKRVNVTVNDNKGGVVDVNETLLAHLVSVTDDKQLIRDELLNILIAGRDTTAATLTFAVYLLALDPGALGKLRKEVLDVVGPTERPTFDHIREMKYLRAVINETLRLFPPVPFNIKESVESRAWTNPDTGIRYYIPANSKFVAPFAAPRCQSLRIADVDPLGDPTLWGPDSLKFDPERWIDDRKAYVTRNPFIFLPFQAGPRICVGQQFAYNEASFFLIRLLQKFDAIELAPDGQPTACRPPEVWKTISSCDSRKPVEHFIPKAHLTLYAKHLPIKAALASVRSPFLHSSSLYPSDPLLATLNAFFPPNLLPPTSSTVTRDIMAKKQRCQFKSEETTCNSAAIRIVGDCPHCEAHFCGQHRLPEQHACQNLESCKAAAFERNREKLEGERTVSSKLVSV